MKYGHFWGALIFLAMSCMRPAYAGAAPRGIIDAVGDRQSFYLLDSTSDARFGASRLTLYLFGGDLSVPLSAHGGSTGTRYAVLATISEPHPIQLVEVGNLDCEREFATPAFRAAYGPDGKLVWSGPITEDPAKNYASLLTPAATAKAASILCHDANPDGALKDRTILDLR